MNPTDDTVPDQPDVTALTAQLHALRSETGDLHSELAARLHRRLSQFDQALADQGLTYDQHPDLARALAYLTAEVDTLVGSASRLQNIPPQLVTAEWNPPQSISTTVSTVEPVLTVVMPDHHDIPQRLHDLGDDRTRVEHLHPLLRASYADQRLTAVAVITLFNRALRTYAKTLILDPAAYHETVATVGAEFPRYIHALLDTPLAREVVLREWRRDATVTDSFPSSAPTPQESQ